MALMKTMVKWENTHAHYMGGMSGKENDSNVSAVREGEGEAPSTPTLERVSQFDCTSGFRL